MSPDPAGQFWSPYLGMGNNPIIGVDPNGKEIVVSGSPEFVAKMNMYLALLQMTDEGEFIYNKLHNLKRKVYIQEQQK